MTPDPSILNCGYTRTLSFSSDRDNLGLEYAYQTLTDRRDLQHETTLWCKKRNLKDICRALNLVRALGC